MASTVATITASPLILAKRSSEGREYGKSIASTFAPGGAARFAVELGVIVRGMGVAWRADPNPGDA